MTNTKKKLDLFRSSQLCQVRMKIPLTAPFPANTMKVQRILVAIESMNQQDLLERLSRAFWVSFRY